MTMEEAELAGMAYLVDRVCKLERAHTILTKHGSPTDELARCMFCDCETCDDDCEWVKAKELKL